MSDETPQQSGLPTATQVALANVVHDIELAAARAGWDHAASLYALVATQDLLDQDDLPADIAGQLRQGWDGTPEHLSAIIQEDLPEDDLEELLGHLAWPDSVVGAALTVERIIVPPEVEEQAPEDPEEAVEFVSSHPSRQDVRLAAGVLRGGETWTAVRARAFDQDDKVGSGSNLVPALVDALRASFAPVEDEEGTPHGAPTGDAPQE
ncbi:MAG: PPA1309 family protein [Actinomyces sp.]|nr:PPA1309 family protein [Actinomyces sp.]MDN6794773.1 PPA1309 family protein [Propionibacterium sp.]